MCVNHYLVHFHGKNWLEINCVIKHSSNGYLQPKGKAAICTEISACNKYAEGHSRPKFILFRNKCRWSIDILALTHYGDVIMGALASQITSLTVVYSTVYSDADQRKYQSSVSLAFVRVIQRGPVNSPHKWPLTRKAFPFDDVIMKHGRVVALTVCRTKNENLYYPPASGATTMSSAWRHFCFS